MITIMASLNNNGSALWGSVIVGLLAITGIGFFVRKYLKRRGANKNKKVVTNNKKNQTTATTVGLERNAGETDTRQHEKPQQELPVGLVERLKPNVARFAGNFGALLSVSTGSDEDIALAGMTFQNVADVIDARCDEQVKTWFSEFTKDRKVWDAALYKDKATIFMKLFKDCGLTIFEETMDRWSDKASIRYNRIVQIEEGAPCKIVAPCWMLNGIVIEKGMVIVR